MKSSPRWSNEDVANQIAKNPDLRLARENRPNAAPSPKSLIRLPSERSGKGEAAKPRRNRYSEQSGELGNPWSAADVEFLKLHYPQQGRAWCAETLGRTESGIRAKASKLRLKQDRSSSFFKDWQRRAGQSKVGKKRPEQAAVLRRLHAEGKLVQTESQKEAIGKRTKAWIAANGHPRGALGMKHTAESAAKISRAGKAAWARLSEAEKDAHADKSLRARIANGHHSRPRPETSWKAGWREIGGVSKYYRSRWEANYARYLQWLKEQKMIKNWEHEPKTFWFEPIKRGCRTYLPDFLVTENDDSEVYHEVKGWMDARSLTKIKRMRLYYPDIKLLVIDSRQYRALKLQVSRIIPEWE